MKFTGLLTCVFALSVAVNATIAAELEAPAGEVILTVSGAIANTNGAGVAEFDLAMLEGLGTHETVTQTPWYDGARSFSGPLGSALLDAVGASGETLTVTAINDYVSEIPVADFKTWPVILATRLDGETMSVREKGPIFVIYPFDADNSLNSEVYYGRSAWQVKSIDVH